jgi:hypothetical protein
MADRRLRCAAGGAAEPRAPIERLYQQKLITAREYEAALHVEALHRKLTRGQCRHSENLLRMARDACDEIEIDAWAMVRLVCCSYRDPNTADGIQRLRVALQAIHFSVDQVLAASENAEGTA